MKPLTQPSPPSASSKGKGVAVLGSRSAEGQRPLVKGTAQVTIECPKRRNRHSLPALPLDHSRNVSASSDDTLVSSQNGSSSSSPIASNFSQALQYTAEKMMREKQADKMYWLEEECEALRTNLAHQTERAKELETNFKICQKDRQYNLDTALRLYGKAEKMVLVETRNMLDQIGQLKVEVQERDSLIWSRDQLIDALRLELDRYASLEHWVLLWQNFQALQQKYGQMPQDLYYLERKYEDLEDEHIDVSNKLRKLEGDYIELKIQRDQISDERDQLEDEAESSKQSSTEMAARLWALEVKCEENFDQKVKYEKKAKAREQLLTDVAARMFKRVISMAGVLENMDVDPMDEEQITLCQLARKHLGIDAAEIDSSFEKTGTSGDNGVGQGGDASGVREPHAGDVTSPFSMSKTNKHQPKAAVTGTKVSSLFASIGGKGVSESPDTFHARRRCELAAAEEKLLGPLGLGFEDGSPTLKTRPVFETAKSPKKSKFMGLFPKSTDTPSEGLRSHSTVSANDIDQVTPARTGGTGGIARDERKVAGDDLEGFTEVFRGPKAQPIDLLSPPAALKSEPSPGFTIFNSVPTTPSGKGSPIPQNLGARDEARKEKAHTTPSLSKAAFHAAETKDFDFGGSSRGAPFIGSDYKSLSTQPNHRTTEHETPEQVCSPPITTTNPPKAKKAKHSSQKQPQEPKNDGPNRKQRRAALQARKEGEKKAQLAQEKARKLKAKGKKGGVGKAKGV